MTSKGAAAICAAESSVEWATTYIATGGASSLPRKVRRLLTCLDGSLTLGEACRAAGIPEAHGVSIARKLLRMEAIRPAGFSALEERFFSAELEPLDACDEPFESWADRLLRRWQRLVVFLERGPGR